MIKGSSKYKLQLRKIKLNQIPTIDGFRAVQITTIVYRCLTIFVVTLGMFGKDIYIYVCVRK